MNGYVRLHAYELQGLLIKARARAAERFAEARERDRRLSSWELWWRGSPLEDAEWEHSYVQGRARELEAAIEGDRCVWLSIADTAWLRRKAGGA